VLISALTDFKITFYLFASWIENCFSSLVNLTVKVTPPPLQLRIQCILVVSVGIQNVSFLPIIHCIVCTIYIIICMCSVWTEYIVVLQHNMHKYQNIDMFAIFCVNLPFLCCQIAKALWKHSKKLPSPRSKWMTRMHLQQLFLLRN